MKPLDQSVFTLVQRALITELKLQESAWKALVDDAHRELLTDQLTIIVNCSKSFEELETQWLFPTIMKRIPDQSVVFSTLITEQDFVENRISRLLERKVHRTEIAKCLADLAGALEKHRVREQRDVIPFVSATISPSEWDGFSVQLVRRVCAIRPEVVVPMLAWYSDSDEIGQLKAALSLAQRIRLSTNWKREWRIRYESLY